MAFRPRNTPTITPILGSAHGIREAALTYNAEYPEAAAEIAAGIPIVEVRTDTADSLGQRFKVVIDSGVIAPDGLFIGTGVTQVVTLDSFDGRLSHEAMTRKLYATEFAAVHVPVRFIRVGA